VKEKIEKAELCTYAVSSLHCEGKNIFFKKKKKKEKKGSFYSYRYFHFLKERKFLFI
jgi:hypothetical protein